LKRLPQPDRLIGYHQITLKPKEEVTVMSKAKKRIIVNYQGIIVGIDIGKDQHVVVALAPDGRFSKPVKIHNSREGYEDLLCRIIQWKKEYTAHEVMVGMESTGHYWEVPARWLAAKGIQVVQVNALHTKRAKEIEDNSPGKTDPKDARIIAQLVRYGKYLSYILPEGSVAELRELVRIRQHLVTELTEKRNYLRRLLDSVFPEIFTVFKKSWGKTFLHLLHEYPLPEDMISAGLSTVTARLKERCRNIMAKKLHNVYVLAWTTVGVPVAHGAYRIGITNTVERIMDLQEKKSEVEKQMESLLVEISEAAFLLSVKGIGVISVAVILGETGGLSRYAHAEEVIKLAGLNLFEISSGKHKGKVRISKRGRPLLRHILFLLATIQAKKGMPLYREYEQLIERNMASVKALIALSRKLVRVLFALVRDKRFYSYEEPALLKMAA
jgi:transposase